MRVSDLRKAIPLAVRLEVLARQARCAACGDPLGTRAAVRFDHRPALVAREVAGSDFDPPQNDPNFIEAIHADCHAFRTTGRRPGATKTSTTRGSDIGEAARTKRIAAQHEEHKRRMADKARMARERDAEERRAKMLKPKRGKERQRPRWPKRKFQKRRV